MSVSMSVRNSANNSTHALNTNIRFCSPGYLLNHIYNCVCRWLRRFRYSYRPVYKQAFTKVIQIVNFHFYFYFFPFCCKHELVLDYKHPCSDFDFLLMMISLTYNGSQAKFRVTREQLATRNLSGILNYVGNSLNSLCSQVM